MKKNITTSIGTINLNDITFVEDTLDVFIGIDSVSAAIQDKINEAIEIAKAKYLWHINTDNELSLWIHIKSKEFSFCICVDIINPENGDFISSSIEVDLSEHQDELKKVIVKAIIDKFF